MSSLQLVCINYGNFDDAISAVEYCLIFFRRFDKATIIHPTLESKKYNHLIMDFGRKTFTSFELYVELIKAQSQTQNECFLYELPKYITCDHAIGIQWDGFIVNPEAWTDEFLEYDLIAPPWPITNLPNPEHRIGSGGFIMFSKRMSELWGSLCDKHSFNDWQIGATRRESFEKRGMKYAPLELAMRFGEEIPLDDQKPLGYTPFAFHGFQYGDHEKYRKLIYG